MSLIKWNWLRRIVRRHTNPMTEDHAGLWKRRLSYAYMLLAWNAFGFVVYMIYSGKGDWAKYYGLQSDNHLTAAQQWSKTLGIKEAKVYRVSGLRVSSYEIHNDFEDKEGTKDTAPENTLESS